MCSQGATWLRSQNSSSGALGSNITLVLSAKNFFSLKKSLLAGMER